MSLAGGKKSADLEPGTKLRWAGVQSKYRPEVVTLERRKHPDDDNPHGLEYRDGWWCAEGGGLADEVIDDPDSRWSLLDGRPGITPAQFLALRVLGDGEWHRARRSVHPGTVLGMVAAALARQGLAERRGMSKLSKPTGPGYSYRITDAGRTAVANYLAGAW